MIGHLPLIAIILLYVAIAFVYFHHVQDKHTIVGTLYLLLGVAYLFELLQLRRTLDVVLQRMNIAP